MPKSKPRLQSRNFRTSPGSKEMKPEQHYVDEIIDVQDDSDRDLKKDGRNGTKPVSAWGSLATLDPVFTPGIAPDKSTLILEEDEEEKSRWSKMKAGGCSRGAVVGAGMLLIVLSVLIAVFLSPISPIKQSSSEPSITQINAPNNTSDDEINLDEDPIIPNQDDSEDNPPTDAPTTASPTTSSPTTPNPTEDPASAPLPQEFEILTHTKTASFELLDIVPHDTKAFTQGLEVLSSEKIEIMKQRYESAPLTPPILPSYAIESTEMDEESTFRIVELETGNVVQELKLEDDTHSGGGCTYYYVPTASRNINPVVRVVQLTYKSGRGYVYELSMPTSQQQPQWSLTRIGDFDFTGGTTTDEGWGIVYHPPRDQFIVSDGSRFLHCWKLIEKISATNESFFSFELMEKFSVKENRDTWPDYEPQVKKGDWKGVLKVNELEWDPYSYGGNTILANVWKSNEIRRIWVGLPVDGRGLDENGSVRTRKLNPVTNQIQKDKKDAGKISHVYDLTELEELAMPSKQGAVLNGIAFVYDSSAAGSTNNNEQQFWATGKYWKSMYRIRLIDE